MMCAAALARCVTVVSGAVVLAVALGACSTPVEGAAVTESAPATTANADGVDVDALQPGNYPTTRRPAAVPSEQNGIRVDAQRMADYVTIPWEVDASLTEPLMLAIGVLTEPKAVAGVLPDPGREVASAHGFLYGFSSARADRTPGQETTTLSNAVLRFRTDEDARTVADMVHQQSPEFLQDSQAVVIPGHPEALATRSTYLGKARITSVVAHGPFVLVQEVKADNAEVGPQLVAKTLDLQAPAIDGFTPAPVEELATLDTDPTGLFSRTVVVEEPKLPLFGVYGRHGILHFRSPRDAEWYETAGVDAASWGPLTLIYQTRDEETAAELADEVAEALSEGAQPAAEVVGMSEAKCLFKPDTPVTLTRYTCVTPADRWVIVAGSQQERDAGQLLAAQYLMLVGKS